MCMTWIGLTTHISHIRHNTHRRQLYRPDADRLDPAELVVSGEVQVEAHKIHLFAVVRG